MRRTGPFSQYNRYIAFHGVKDAGSLLAGFAGQEAHLIVSFKEWCCAK